MAKLGVTSYLSTSGQAGLGLRYAQYAIPPPSIQQIPYLTIFQYPRRVSTFSDVSQLFSTFHKLNNFKDPTEFEYFDAHADLIGAGELQIAPAWKPHNHPNVLKEFSTLLLKR